MRKLLFVTIGGSPDDRKFWSGTPYSMFNELQKHFDVTTLSLRYDLPIVTRVRSIASKLLGKKSHVLFDLDYAKKISKTLNKKTTSERYDVVLVVGASPLIEVNISVPFIYFSDAVFSSMVDYYWFNLAPYYVRSGNLIQERSLINSARIVMTSEWAKAATIRDYHIDADKIDVIHFGPNVDIDKTFKHREHAGINLLFLGVSWERKGADYAIECVLELNQRDKNNRYHLHMAGCDAPRKIEDKNITIYGFLDKNIREQREQLDYLREISDIFILPTKAECSAISFCEASAYSLPTITFDTGGTRDYIRNGENGYCLDLRSATGKDFADVIYGIVNEPHKLEYMQKKCKEIYETDLNWSVFGNKITYVVEKAIDEFSQHQGGTR